ncbi:hypothetical protein B0682_07845 [Moraxella lincolnii]|uniref:Uncharacterized protein n=1 Tax=Lwoffella lincolnii TaxID=90241 RepID=A0A1T0CBY5_9GAMM|nr:hypothetical protein [Moraxella lincolnii]OOS19846.1 hypothetical protein B0682_07845 [Moraxella lincolnii]
MNSLNHTSHHHTQHNPTDLEQPILPTVVDMVDKNMVDNDMVDIEIDFTQNKDTRSHQPFIKYSVGQPTGKIVALPSTFSSTSFASTSLMNSTAPSTSKSKASTLSDSTLSASALSVSTYTPSTSTMPKHVSNSPAVVNASARRRQSHTQQQEQQGVTDHLFYAFICGVMLGMVGGLIDVMLMVIGSLTTTISTIQWLFTPILAVMGVLLGLFAGNHAGGHAMQLFHVFGSDNFPGNNDDAGIFKAIGFGLMLSCLGYVMLMMMA